MACRIAGLHISWASIYFAAPAFEPDPAVPGQGSWASDAGRLNFCEAFMGLPLMGRWEKASASVALRACGVFLLALVGGCNLFQLRPLAPERPGKDAIAGTPGKHSYRLAPYVFLADFDIPRNSPVLKDLAGLRDQVYKELRLSPSSNIIQVYLFADRDKYEKFMEATYPDLPRRRAFFVAQPQRIGNAEDLLVYTYWGDRIQQDLRHELTHALLHSVLKDVPLWLDEGLAEFFEAPAQRSGLNQQHLEQLRRNNPAPVFNLDRLEQLSEVQQMTSAEYREAWAWVSLMLRGTPQARKVLLDYVHELRTNPRPGPLRPRLAAVCLSLDDALRRHLAGLGSPAAPR